MQIEITEKKVRLATKDGEQEVPVGTRFTVDKFPESLFGKARIVGDEDGKTLVVNIEELRARYEQVVGRKPDPKAKPETLQKAIAQAEAEELEELQLTYLQLTGNAPGATLDAAALQTVITDLKAKK